MGGSRSHHTDDCQQSCNAVGPPGRRSRAHWTGDGSTPVMALRDRPCLARAPGGAPPAAAAPSRAGALCFRISRRWRRSPSSPRTFDAAAPRVGHGLGAAAEPMLRPQQTPLAWLMAHGTSHFVTAAFFVAPFLRLDNVRHLRVATTGDVYGRVLRLHGRVYGLPSMVASRVPRLRGWGGTKQ